MLRIGKDTADAYSETKFGTGTCSYRHCRFFDKLVCCFYRNLGRGLLLMPNAVIFLVLYAALIALVAVVG